MFYYVSNIIKEHWNLQIIFLERRSLCTWLWETSDKKLKVQQYRSLGWSPVTNSYAEPSLVRPPCLPGKLEYEIGGLQSSLQVPGKEELSFANTVLFMLFFHLLKKGWEERGKRYFHLCLGVPWGTCAWNYTVSYKRFSFPMPAIQGWQNIRYPGLSKWPPLEVLGNTTCNLKTKLTFPLQE